MKRHKVVFCHLCDVHKVHVCTNNAYPCMQCIEKKCISLHVLSQGEKCKQFLRDILQGNVRATYLNNLVLEVKETNASLPLWYPLLIKS